MTSNRRRKADTRAHQAATGAAYMVARRQIMPPTLAEVMEQHPLLCSFGMERATGTYVSNGEFIAAALIAGYPFKYAQPNVLFGMSARDVKRLNPVTRGAIR